MKSRQMVIIGLAGTSLALALSASSMPEPEVTPPLQIQVRIPKSAFSDHLCLDCGTGPFTTQSATIRPVKLQIDPDTGETFLVP